MAELPIVTLAWLALAAFATGVIHGATGLAGGVVMAAILAHVIGIKAAVPVMTAALILSHASRAYMYIADTDWRVARTVLTFGAPMIVVGALVFGYLSPRMVAIVFAVFLLASLPVKRWAARQNLRTGPRLLAGASTIWGLLAGNVIGPGFFLTPFVLGTGLGRLAFVGTMAFITLVMNGLKLAVFGATEPGSEHERCQEKTRPDHVTRQQ
ncbi:MAG: sulfite exporter TauE/SafE family protein, partial [Pseudomonadota bacterium]